MTEYNVKIWLDDERPAPDNSWIVCRNYDQFLESVSKYYNKISVISFDHDIASYDSILGKEMTGYDAMCLIEENVFLYNMSIPEVLVHTANPAGRKRMEQVAYKLNIEREKNLQKENKLA